MNRPPIDRAIRDRVAAELGTSFALEASAGAGKTSVLVERAVSALRRGIEPARLAAITFTEKAAGELAERVLDRLDRALEAEADPLARARLERALVRLPDLTTSTIHAFALELLQREAFAAGWSPRTEILAETLVASAVDEAYEGWRIAFDLRHPDLAVEIRQHAAESTIQAAAVELLRNRDLEPVVAQQEIDWAPLRQDLDALSRALRETALSCKKPALCKLLDGNASLLAKLIELERMPDHDAVRAALETNDTKAGGRAADWSKNGHLAFKDRIEALRGWRKHASGTILARLHCALIMDMKEHFLPAVRQRKLDRGQADYDDLLFRCLEMLRRNAVARARLASRFDAILIDEVQDTDPVQAEIVVYLTRETELDGDWRLHPPLPGRLFAVGDPKQSIYRFRRADVATWREISALITKDGEPQRLHQNFRSVPGIVAFANHVFSGLPSYQPIEAYRGPGEIDPIVVLRSEADAETEAAARYLHRLLSSDARVIDPSGERRPLQKRDVMILLPAWTHAEETHEKLLDAGIDAIVEGGATFFERDEVRLALAAIRALDEPTDAEAIVFLLRGLFGLSHDMLAKHVAAGGSWNYTAPAQPKGDVAEALAHLRARYRERSRRTLNALIDDLLEHTRAPAVWSLTPRGRAMLANLDKVRELIRQFEAVTNSPAEVVERFEAMRAAETEQDLPVADSDTDAVKVTTLFKAKGLEAPVVIILHARRKLDSPQAIIDRDAGEVAIKAKDLRPLDFDLRLQAEKEARQDEMRRWMYVAATRARDQLVICQTDTSTLLSHDLQRGLSEIEHLPHESTKEIAAGLAIRVIDPAALPPPPARAETFPGLDPIIDALLSHPPATTDEAAQRFESSRTEEVQRAIESSIHWQSVTQAVKPVRSGTTYGGGVGSLGGTVVHRVMEHLDLGRPRAELQAEVEMLVRSQALLAGLDAKRTQACEAVVRSLLEHPVVDRARAAPERWQEVPFAFPDDGRIITGTIDLCFPLAADRRQWIVVDWKSNLPPAGTPERASYERQLEIYARALIATMVGHPIEVVERVLAGPHPSLEPDPWEAALELVREELAEGLAAWSELGVPAPEVGAQVEGHEVELWWSERRVALVVDAGELALDALGRAEITVVAVRTVDPFWDRSALRDLNDVLGVEAPVQD